FSALKLEKLAMAFVVFLICVVAAFNVVGTLTMVVRDKTREIGILLAMGLKQPSIRRIFLAQGILVGLTGTSLGVLLEENPPDRRLLEPHGQENADLTGLVAHHHRQ